MVFLGIVLAAVAVAIGVGVIVENSSSASLTFFNHHVPGVTSEAHVFIAGAVVATFVFAGLAMAMLSLGRAVRARRELQDLRDEHQETMSTLKRKNQQLQRELAHAHAAGSAPEVSGRPGGVRTEPASPFFDHP
jgi:hypothetical protein